MRTAIGGIGLAGASLLFQRQFQALAGIFDMLAQESAGRGYIALAAKLEDPMMFFIGPCDSVSQVQLQAGVSFSAVVDVANDGHEARLIGSRVKNGMELPIQASPGGDVIFAIEFADVLTQDGVSFGDVIACKVWDREFQDLGLKQGANSEQLFDIRGRKCGNNGATIRDDRDQALGIELAQSLPNRNATDLILSGNGLLAELSSLGNLAADDLVAEFIGYC